MENSWLDINDDELNFVEKTTHFLQSEFCPPNTDPMWSTEYFRWKLGSANPGGKGHISIAIMEDRVIGTVSLTKKRILVDGIESIGGEIGDSYSSASVRRKGQPARISSIDPDPKSYLNKSIFGRLASEVRARAEAGGISVIYGTPNENAYPGWIKRLGYFDFKECGNKSFSRPTTKWIVGRHPSTSFLAPVLRSVELSSIAFQKFSFRMGARRKLCFDVEIPLAEELDDLWVRRKPTHGFSLVRDAQYWKHRYQDHPIARYTFFCFREGSRLVGVLVTRFSSVGGGKHVVHIVEWMLEEHVRFGYCLAIVMYHYRNSGVETFNLWAQESSQDARSAIKSLFVPRHSIPIILADTVQARAFQSSFTSMHFFLGSSDAA